MLFSDVVVALILLFLVGAGDLLQLGEVTVFRFNHPEEARNLKDQVREGRMR